MVQETLTFPFHSYTPASELRVGLNSLGIPSPAMQPDQRVELWCVFASQTLLCLTGYSTKYQEL